MTRTKSQKLRALQARMSRASNNSVQNRQRAVVNTNRVNNKPSRNRRSNNNSSQKSMGVSSQSQMLSSYFRVTGQNNKDGHMRISGQDFLSAIESSSTVEDPPGTNILNLPINPLQFAGTRLANFAQLFEKFCFKTLRFHFQPSNSTISDGSIILAFSRDIRDVVPAATVQGVREYLAFQGTKTTQVWKGVTINCPLIDTQDFYYTDTLVESDRLVFQGRFFVALLTVISHLKPLAGSIWVEYDILLMDPHLEPVSPLATFGVGHYVVRKAGEVVLDEDPLKPGKMLSTLDALSDPIQNYKFFTGGMEFIADDTVDYAHISLPEGNYTVICMYGRNIEIPTETYPVYSLVANVSAEQTFCLADYMLASGGESNHYAWAYARLIVPQGGANLYVDVGQAEGTVEIQPDASGPADMRQTLIQLVIYSVPDVSTFIWPFIDSEDIPTSEKKKLTTSRKEKKVKETKENNNSKEEKSSKPATPILRSSSSSRIEATRH